MKSFLIVFVAVFALASANFQSVPENGLSASKPENLGINDQIIKLIENMKKQMKCGFPDLGIPILAPLEKPYTEIQHIQGLIEILASVIDLRVDGLDNFDVNKISFNVLNLKFNFDFTFKEIQVRSEYVANCFLLKVLRIKGRGDLDLLLKDFRVAGMIQIGANAKGLYVRDFQLTLALGEFKSDITGLLWGKYSGKMANKMVEKIVPWVIINKHDEITGVARKIVMEQANEAMKGLTIKDILDLINSQKDPVECIPPSGYVSEEELAFQEFKDIMQLV